MPHVYADRVLQYTDTFSSTDFTLPGVVTAGFRRFASVMSVGDTCFYCAQNVDAFGALGSEWEVGLGTLGTNLLTRTTVYSNSAGTTVPLAFTGPGIEVAMTAIADRSLLLDNIGTTFLPLASAEPATPSNNRIALYARQLAPGLTALKVKYGAGNDTYLQDALAYSRVIKFTPTSTTAPGMTAGGTPALTSVGTISLGPLSTSSLNVLNSALRAIYTTTATTAGTLTSLYQAAAGSNAVVRTTSTGQGGFKVTFRFSLVTLIANMRGFIGLTDVVTSPANIDPTTNTTPGKVGLALTNNTGNFSIVTNVTGTVPTVTALGASFPIDTTSLYELVLYCRPGNGTTAGDITWTVRRFTTDAITPAATTSGTISGNLPAANTLLYPAMWLTNNITTGNVAWSSHGLTIESNW